MKQLAYAVRDSKAERFLPPFFAINRAVALRMFSQACTDTGHQFNQHSGDFTLFEVGTFDDETGSIASNEKGHENLGLAAQYKQSTMSRTEVMMGKDYPSSVQGGE